MLPKRPLFLKISQNLLEDIHSGKYKEILPAEQELAELYGVSRPTVRSALQKLNDENVVTTIHGRGTFIASAQRDPRLRLDKMKGFYQLLIDAGHKVEIKELGQEELGSFQAEQNLPPEFSTPVFLIKRLLLSDGIPSIYIEEHLPEVYLKQNVFSRLPDSIYDIIAKLTNHRIKYTISEFFPMMPPVRVAEMFGIVTEMPVFLANETHYNMLNKVMVYSRVYINTANREITLAVVRTR